MRSELQISTACDSCKHGGSKILERKSKKWGVVISNTEEKQAPMVELKIAIFSPNIFFLYINNKTDLYTPDTSIKRTPGKVPNVSVLYRYRPLEAPRHGVQFGAPKK